MNHTVPCQLVLVFFGAYQHGRSIQETAPSINFHNCNVLTMHQMQMKIQLVLYPDQYGIEANYNQRCSAQTWCRDPPKKHFFHPSFWHSSAPLISLDKLSLSQDFNVYVLWVHYFIHNAFLLTWAVTWHCNNNFYWTNVLYQIIRSS